MSSHPPIGSGQSFVVAKRGEIDWSDDMARAIGGFFIVLALAKLIAPAEVLEACTRVGLPGWLRIGAGSLELVIAGLLMWSRSRALGVILAATTSACAAFLLLLEAEFRLVPLCIILLVALLATALRIDGLRRKRTPHTPTATKEP